MRVRAILPLATLLLAASLQGCKSDQPGDEPPPTQPVGEGVPSGTGGEHPPLASGHGPEDGGLPPGHPPVDESVAAADGTGGIAQPDPASGRGTVGLTWTMPGGWVEETPSSPMRRAQYRVPGAGGNAELVVFYFGPGQGGDAASNAQRWASQFQQPDGGNPVEAMRTETLDVGGTKVLLVETSGTYVNTMGVDAGEKPGYALLGAIVEGPDSHWFFKMTGPAATVKGQRDTFLGMIRTVRKGA